MKNTRKRIYTLEMKILDGGKISHKENDLSSVGSEPYVSVDVERYDQYGNIKSAVIEINQN